MATRTTEELVLNVLDCIGDWQLASSMWKPEIESAMDRAGRGWRPGHTHTHPYREVLVPLAGTGAYGGFGDVLRCRCGSIFLFDEQDSHDSDYPPSCATMEHLWIGIVHGHYLVRRLRIRGTDAGGHSVVGKLTLRQTGSEACLGRCWSEVKEKPALPQPLVRARILASLTVLLSRIVEAVSTGGSESLHTSQAEIVAAIREHIDRTAGRDDNLETLSRIAGYSKYHFLRIFRHHTGRSVHAYIDECRLRRRAALLERGCSKKEIAFELGFSCPSAFSRWERNSGLGNQAEGDR